MLLHPLLKRLLLHIEILSPNNDDFFVDTMYSNGVLINGNVDTVLTKTSKHKTNPSWLVLFVQMLIIYGGRILSI